MIEEQATVIAVQEDTVTVKSTVKSACSGCQQVDTCGSGQVAKAIPQKSLTLTLSNTLEVQVGDKVMIGILEKPLLQTAWQVYLLPLFGLFLFAFFGQLLTDNWSLNHEFLVIVFAIFGGYFGFKGAQWLQQKKAKNNQLEAMLLRVL